MHKNAKYMEPIHLDYDSRTGIAVQLVHISLQLPILEEESFLLTDLKEQGSYLLFFYAL